MGDQRAAISWVPTEGGMLTLIDEPYTASLRSSGRYNRTRMFTEYSAWF